jgi:hypothetical protein
MRANSESFHSCQGKKNETKNKKTNFFLCAKDRKRPQKSKHLQQQKQPANKKKKVSGKRFLSAERAGGRFLVSQSFL